MTDEFYQTARNSGQNTVIPDKILLGRKKEGEQKNEVHMNFISANVWNYKETV